MFAKNADLTDRKFDTTKKGRTLLALPFFIRNTNFTITLLMPTLHSNRQWSL